MNLYKTRPFSRLARKAGITDDALKNAVEEMRKGIIHADLGDNVYKQRVAIPDRGKRGGSRVIVAPTCGTDGYLFIATSKGKRRILRLMKNIRSKSLPACICV